MLCKRADGSRFWLGVHLIPARKSTTQFFVTLGRDITEEVQERQQQSATEGLLAKVFLCVQVPVAIVTADGLVQMTNPAFDHLLRYPPGRLLGKRAIEYVAPNTRPIVAAARQRQLDEGHDYTVVANLLTSDGADVDYGGSERSSPLQDNNVATATRCSSGHGACRWQSQAGRSARCQGRSRFALAGRRRKSNGYGGTRHQVAVRA